MYSRTYNFLAKYNQIYTSQYGFRTGHSCQDAIAELIGEITRNMDEGLYTIGVFLDLSKAFDTLEHGVLLEKLSIYGIRGVALKWFQSYLEKRQLRVKCMTAASSKEEYSNYEQVTYGTPQGSCLGEFNSNSNGADTAYICKHSACLHTLKCAHNVTR